MNWILFFFIILYLSGGILDLKKRRIREERFFLVLCCIILAIFSGLRSAVWPDTAQYIYAFSHEIKSLPNFKGLSDITVFKEPGFVLLSSLVKTFFISPEIYLLLIAVITMALIYKSLTKYCVFPLLGLSVYLSRFFISRNMMQIRAALAIAIVLLAIKYIQSREFRKFILVVMSATIIHYSSIIAIPLYWLYNVRLSFNKCFLILGGSITLVGVGSELIKEQIAQLNYLMGMDNTYVGGDETYSQGLGLLNPMIYYQCVIMGLWLRMPLKYQNKTKYYQVFKMGYFYSTITLILFSPLLVMAGRLSTVFATLEIMMIPYMLQVYNKRTHSIQPYLVTGGLLLVLFYMNLYKVRYIL